jgi:lipoate-protein ligase A
MVDPRLSSEYVLANWRVLDTGWRDGPTNMAIDEAILHAVSMRKSLPTLRFYGWDPPCLSLGYAQRWEVVDTVACAQRGWDVVRRPTGGRAILHIDELTYSVCVPESEPRVHGGLLASYRRLSDALAAGLERLGLQPARAQPDGAQHGADLGAACFDTPSNFEITVDGRKLVGSAQARKKGVVLQHGTLPLYGDIARIIEGLSANEERRAELRRRLLNSAITLEASLGRRLTYDQAVVEIGAGFASALNLRLEPGALSDWEIEQAEQIRADKFGSPEWTRRL